MPDDLPASSVEIFFSYSHKDEALREEMDKHLSSLWWKGVAKKWHDRRIDPGAEWAGEIDVHLNSAQIILLLITPDYMASDYCRREMTRALERHSNREARVIPIILRHVNWPEAPYSHLLVLPKDSKPVSAWLDRDEVFKEVANAITNLVDEPKSTWFDNYEPPEPPAERPHFWTKAPVWLYGLLALVTLALVFGVFRGKWKNPTTESDQTSQPAVARDLSSDRNPNTNIQKPEKLAFAAGWSVALIGQSSKRTGNEVFGQALTELGFGATEAKEFEDKYVALEAAARAQKIDYQSFETAKSELLMKVDTRLRAFGGQHTTAYVGFGYDLGALRLLLKFWETLKTQGDLLSTVNDRLVSLQRSVKGVTVPASLSEKILALRPNDLTDDTYRISATQALDEVVTYFEMSPP